MDLKPSEIARQCFSLINRLTGELDAANQHVKILQDSLADLSASKKDAVSEGCEIPVAVGYRCLDCNYDRVFADLKRLGQADLEIGICPACGEWSIAIVFARPVLI